MDKKDLETGFKSMVQSDIIIRRQKRTDKNKKKTLFLSIIKKYDEALTKSVMLQSQFRIDLSDYEEVFYNVIDDILLLAWGESIFQLIGFYFYERLNNDTGEEQFIVGQDLQPIYVRTPEDLWEVINKLHPGTFD